MKYLYMTYYFSDLLSILTGDLGGLKLQAQHFEAIRSLQSFKELVYAVRSVIEAKR